MQINKQHTEDKFHAGDYELRQTNTNFFICV